MLIAQIKRILFYLATLTFLCAPSGACFTLGDILNASPELQHQKPSSMVQPSPVSEKITIKDEPYQIRYFAFEAKPLDNRNVRELTFLEFAKAYNLQNTPVDEYIPQTPPVSLRASLYPTYSVFNTFEKSGVWFHYMIVLGKAETRSH